jgi:hypothetical protein
MNYGYFIIPLWVFKTSVRAIMDYGRIMGRKLQIICLSNIFWTWCGKIVMLFSFLPNNNSRQHMLGHVNLKFHWQQISKAVRNL